MSDHDRAATPSAKTSTEPTSAEWACPMHPEVRSDQPGRCPKCRMFLVEVR